MEEGGRREREENDKLRGKDKNTDIATTQGDLHMKLQDEEAKCRLERLIEKHWIQIKGTKKKGRNKSNGKRKKKGG